MDLEHIYTNKLTCDLNIINNKILQLEQDKWKQGIKSKPKLRFYCKFKEEKKIEQYVCMHLSPRERSYLCQLRLGILPINIEIGRYRSLPIEKRVCTLCDSNTTEDECHVLFHCSKYITERKTIWIS
jgi:hypothetical protein